MSATEDGLWVDVAAPFIFAASLQARLLCFFPCVGIVQIECTDRVYSAVLTS